MSERYTLVRGDPQLHKADVLDLLTRNLIPSGELAALGTETYESNPAGPPLLFLARDTQSHRFVGTSAIFPVRIRVADEVVLGGVSGDFAVDAEHRGFGPAVALQQGLLDGLEERGLSYVYGVPNRFAEVITQRVGYLDLGRLTRFVKIFQMGVVFERYMRRRSFARLASGISSFRPTRSSFCLRTAPQAVGELLGRKDRSIRRRLHSRLGGAQHQHHVTTERDAISLNWKYERASAGTTTARYPIFALFARNEAAGYIVYTTRGNVREVLDIAFLPSRTVVDALLSEFVLDARREAAGAIDVRYFGPGHPRPAPAGIRIPTPQTHGWVARVRQSRCAGQRRSPCPGELVPLRRSSRHLALQPTGARHVHLRSSLEAPRA